MGQICRALGSQHGRSEGEELAQLVDQGKHKGVQSMLPG